MPYNHGKKLNKIHVCITIDTDIVDEVRERRDNLSGLCNSLLKSYLELDTDSPDKELAKLEEEITSKQSELMLTRQRKRFLEEKQRKNREEYDAQLKKGEIIDLTINE